ncbi:alpha/beta fold hydrolase [Actinoplanes flavus]|uniref:Alpha/beta hydrolase n=1 Tax=Actinoplanes flavus TaxID=2820290 RepID=A0ABS3UVN0_9ACTN|nr:alpha/beta hydrolase [Actinoplanes flavus]MBO3742635.1 alpha/beta hydrolase [Actinoplanes flavus]
MIRRWFARTLAALAVLLGAALFVAYAWQPTPVRYDSPYLAEIQSQYVDTPVARFHYTRTGQGSPVILVAGGGQWLYSYRHLVPVLAERHTVYAVDLPGQGYTTLTEPGFGYDLDAMSGALGDFMTAVGLRRASLVGHSWGGSWSMRLAQRDPDRVDRLVLIGSTGLDVPSSPDWRPLEVPVLGELIGKLMRESDAATMQRKAFANPIPDEVVAENWAPISRPENREAMWTLQRNLDFSITQEHMPRMTTPTFILWGAADRFDHPSQAPDMAGRIPGATYQVLPGCGHNTHEDCPAEANPLIAGFLAR